MKTVLQLLAVILIIVKKVVCSSFRWILVMGRVWMRVETSICMIKIIITRTVTTMTMAAKEEIGKIGIIDINTFYIIIKTNWK